MPLENLEGPDAFIDDLNNAWPLGSDTPSEGDDHLRGIKNVLRNWAGTIGDQPLQDALDALFAPLVHTHLWADITDPPAAFPPAAHTHVSADITDLAATLAPYAPLAAPALTGAATLDGAALATQPYVQGEVHKANNYQGDVNYTPTLDDMGRTIRMAPTGTNRTVTLPPEASVAWPIGARMNVSHEGSGAGQTIIAGGSGVFLFSKEGKVALSDQFSGLTMEYLGSNTWWLVGDLT